MLRDKELLPPPISSGKSIDTASRKAAPTPALLHTAHARAGRALLCVLLLAATSLPSLLFAGAGQPSPSRSVLVQRADSDSLSLRVPPLDSIPVMPADSAV